MTRFELTRYALGPHASIELSQDEYEDLRAAQRRALEFLSFEDLFDLMLRNYEEFERELLLVPLRHATYFGASHDWNESIDTIQLLARRLANLLTTTHGYCDQVPHAISTLYGANSPQLVEVRSFFRHEHSVGLGYRVCTELRKYIQHRGSAVHGYRGYSRWEDRDNSNRVHVYSFAPEVNVAKLRDDPKFKSSVLAELEVGGRQTYTGDRSHDLRPFVRDYVSALGRIHVKVRALFAADVSAVDGRLQEAVDRFLALPGADTPIGLAVMELSDQGLLEGRHPTFIGLQILERRRLLEERNHLPTHFSTQVVTNEVPAATR